MKNIQEFRKDGWEYWGLWKQSLFSAYFWTQWRDQQFLKKVRISVMPDALVILDGHFWVRKDVRESVRKQLEYFAARRDAGFYRSLEKNSRKMLADTLHGISQLSEQEVSDKTFTRCVRLLERAMAPWCLNVILSYPIEGMVRKAAEKMTATYNDVIRTVPVKKTLLMRQYQDALRIKSMLSGKGLLNRASWARIKKDKKVWRCIVRHVQSYAWTGIGNFTGHQLTIEKFLRDIQTITRHIPQKKKAITLPSDARYIVRLCQTVSFLRQYSAEMFALITYRAMPFLERAAGALGISYQDMLSFTPTEIEAALRKKGSAHNGLKRKWGGYIAFAHQNKAIVTRNQREIAWLLTTGVPSAPGDVRELSGSVASAGYARGRAKVILQPDEFFKMEKGDILVTAMTTPEFVPLMHASAAIVTDIGGMLSHAAIISREIGKPCVIGTKIATKVFKDGDLIEVDADKGVVRKIL